MIQIWTALITILLLKYMMFRSQFGWSLSNLIAMLRYNLFTYRNLWEWIDSPYEAATYHTVRRTACIGVLVWWTAKEHIRNHRESNLILK